MIIAQTTVIAGNKTFKPGQIVTGLSRVDKEWMEKAGFITETSNRKKNNTETLDNGQTEVKENEF